MKSIEEFARLRADIEAGASRDEVLARAGLTTPQWIAVQRQWLRAIAREAMRGERRLADRYRHAFMEQVAPPPPEPVDVASAPPAPAGARPRAPAGVPALSPWAPQLKLATQAGVESAGEPLPFVAQAVLPPPSVAAEVRAEAAGLSGETSAVAALTDEEVAASAPSAGVDATVLGVAIDPAALEPLPFRRDDAPRSAPALAATRVAAEAGYMMGETAFVSALEIDEDALPFVALPDLPLARYASLVAELHRRPTDSATILHRYGLDIASFSALERQWKRRIADNPVEYGEFRRCYDLYAAWLEGRPP
jgi:hypothetical protein